jgi:Zn-dependent protease
MLLEFIQGRVAPFEFLIFVIAILLAITVHEFAHAFRAHQAGDPTPGKQGRLTLNPLAHYDPVGTTLLLALGLGWGRAVLTQPNYYRHPRRDGLMISFWGPLSNILLAVGTLLVFRFVPVLKEWGPWRPLVAEIVQWNLLLAFFNLIPLPPLDGSKVLSNLLPIKQAVVYDRFISQYGFLVLMLLLFGGRSFLATWIGVPTDLVIRAVMWGAPTY